MSKPKKQYTKKQIESRVKRMRALMKIVAPDAAGPKNPVGEEVFFDTEVGKVRSLKYGFSKEETLPLVVNIHGSGFTIGSAEMDDDFSDLLTKKLDVKVISIDYSLAPESMFPVALNECYATVKYAKENASELGVDPNRIIIVGHSAGGNFCAGIGLMEKEQKQLGLKGIVLDYPPTDIDTDPYDKAQPKGSLPPGMARIFDAAYRNPEDGKDPLVSPSFATEDMVKDFPPTLVITAGGDSLAPETERLKDTLVSAGVDVTFKRFEGMPHGFTLISKRGAKRRPEVLEKALEAQQMIFDFIKKYI